MVEGKEIHLNDKHNGEDDDGVEARVKERAEKDEQRRRKATAERRESVATAEPEKNRRANRAAHRPSRHTQGKTGAARDGGGASRPTTGGAPSTAPAKATGPGRREKQEVARRPRRRERRDRRGRQERERREKETLKVDEGRWRPP